MNVNLKGALFPARAAARQVIRQTQDDVAATGRIINLKHCYARAEDMPTDENENSE